MNKMLLLLAIITLALGHYFKMLRWKQFIESYERPNNSNLLQSLGAGYIVNFCVPFHVGDLVRIIWSGHKMKNGIGLAIATVIIDRYLDVIVVGALFGFFWIGGFDKTVTVETLLFYSGVAMILIVLSIILIKFSKLPKKFLFRFFGIYNENIRLKLLNVSWTMISIFKDMYGKVKKVKLVLNTLAMWGLYLISYYLIADYISRISIGDKTFQLIDVFMLLFSRDSLNSAAMSQAISTGELLGSTTGIMVLYMIVPLLIILLLSLVLDHREKNKITTKQDETQYINLLPHMDKKEGLNFLEAYFASDRKGYLKNYIAINRNVSIIKDYSAGSNATTLLCMNAKETFFRKYAFGEEAKQLFTQIEWLKQHENEVPLTKVLRYNHTEEYCYYDMPYNNASVNMFNYIHSMPLETGYNTLQLILNELHGKLYQKNVKKAEMDKIEAYIDEKVIKNIINIKKAKELKNLLDYDTLIINGVEYDNFSHFESRIEKDILTEIFKNDECTTIHGDLTIENIICMANGTTNSKYYLIDPNAGNILDTPNVDYAKLMQSLHGGYEFLMQAQNVMVEGNKIDFIYLKSKVYEELFQFYQNYLMKMFTWEKVRSIYYHEIINWLRLMPYKIRKDGKQAVIFYAGFIMVLNDVMNKFEEKNGVTNED